MRIILAILGISLLLLTSLASPVSAGISTSPSEPQINQLNAVANDLAAINMQVRDVLLRFGTGPSPWGTEPSPWEPELNGAIGELNAMAYALIVLNNRVSAVLSIPPEPNVPELLQAFGNVRDGAESIVTTIGSTPPPDPLRDVFVSVRDAAQSIVDLADEYLGTIFSIFLPYSAAASGGFKTHVDLPLNLEGTLNGANFKIRVPVDWNGTLLVYAHGYAEELQAPPVDAAPGGPLGEEALLSMGYAVAGTANRNPGWAVKEGIQNTLALTEFFKGHVGNPEHVILWGFSMGSVIALESIEKYPGIYDGVIAGCGLAAGAPLNFDQTLALSLAYDVAFGWPASWGSVGDIRDNIDFDTVVLPVLLADQDPVLEPFYAAKVEFIRLVCDLPAEVNTIGPFWFSWLFTDMFFATQARGELEQRAGGPVAQNLDHVYELSADEEAYLLSLGLTDAAGLLSQMNARTKIEASIPARKYLERYADFTGDLKRPVITIHTRVDELVREANEGVYRELVEAAGKGDMLVQVFTDSVGHSRFTGEQLLATVSAMDYWLETGEKPSIAVFFPPILGFVPDFVPPPWPFVQ